MRLLSHSLAYIACIVLITFSGRTSSAQAFDFLFHGGFSSEVQDAKQMKMVIG